MGKGSSKGHTPREAKDNLKSTQMLSVIDAISEGPIEGPVDGLKSVLLNSTPVLDSEGNTNISGVTVVFLAGEQEQTPPEGFESSGSETVLGTEVKYDTPITRTITSANIDRLRFTFGVQALVETTSKGDRNPSEVRLLVQIQRNGGWVTEKDITIKGKTTSQYLASVVVGNLPPRPFNIRMRRMTPDSTTDQLQNKTLWSSYTEIIDVKQCYPNTALVGVQVDSEQFGSQQVSRNYHLRGRILQVPSNYNPQTRQYSGIWDGTLKPAYSNNMAWCLWDMLTHPRYGMGKRLGAADVDKWALYVIGQYCDQSVPDGFGGTEPRITCNAYLTTQRKAWDVLSDFCSAMRCMPVWNGQTLTFVQDRPSDKVWTYNRSNVVMPDDGAPFRYSFSALKDRHNAVEVNWIDPDNGWETATELVEDTQAIDTILDEHATMQSLGKDTGTRVQANAVYDLGRSDQNGSITYSSKAISENMVINNGRANVWAGTMVNVSVRGNDGILEVMKPQINYAPAMLVGKVVVSEGASFRTHGAVDTSKADVSLENSAWTIIADITTTNQNTRLNLANLAMSGANVIMMAEPVTRSSVTASAENFTTLTTNTLSGNGNFYMRTDMANHQSDQLNVTGQATGDFKIFVTDTGASPAAGDSLTLVTTGGGDAAFTLGNAGGVVDIGTYEYTLLDNGNHSWSLAENRAQITPSTTDVLNMAAAQPLVFDAELYTVRERLGSVKGVSYDTAMWSSAINTRNNVTTDAGAGFEQTLTGLTLGIDSRFSREESSTIRGLFFGYSHSDIGFDRGGKGNIDSYTLGAYAGWEHQNGAYVDGVVKVDRFANTIHGKMSNGATAFGDYNSNGAGAHVESGFRWVDGLWSVRPYLAFTGFTTDGQDYTLSNGMSADVGNTRILRAEAGTAVSYHMDLQNGTTLEPWLKAAVRQEYADSNQVKVNDDGKFNNDVAGTSGVYQAGIRSSFTPTLSGHLSVSYGNGAGVESPWNTQAGVVWSF